MIRGLRGCYSTRFYFVDEQGFIYMEKGGNSIERIYIDVIKEKA